MALDRLYRAYLLNSRIAHCFYQFNPANYQGSHLFRMLKRLIFWINQVSDAWARQWIESSRLSRDSSKLTQEKRVRLLGYFGLAFFFADVTLNLLLRPGLTPGLLSSMVMVILFLLLTTVSFSWQQVWFGSIIRRFIIWICDLNGEGHL